MAAVARATHACELPPLLVPLALRAWSACLPVPKVDVLQASSVSARSVQTGALDALRRSGVGGNHGVGINQQSLSAFFGHSLPSLRCAVTGILIL